MLIMLFLFDVYPGRQLKFDALPKSESAEAYLRLQSKQEKFWFPEVGSSVKKHIVFYHIDHYSHPRYGGFRACYNC